MSGKINKKVSIRFGELLKNNALYLVENGKVNLKKLQSLLEGKTTEKELKFPITIITGSRKI